jgi:hypothetical protein
MRIRTRPHANRPLCDQLERGGCGPVKRIGWILAGAVSMALVFGANPSAAAAASPASARLVMTPGSHLTSARVPQRSSSSPRADRSLPSRHPANRPHPAGGSARTHQTASRVSRTPHGRGNGHAAALAVLDDFHGFNTSTQVEAAWLRAPRRSFTAAPETRGPPRASPMTNSRPQPSPERPSDCTSRFGRAPSPPQTSQASALRSLGDSPALLCSTHRDWPCSHPHARRFEGAAAWYVTPSGGVRT